MTCLFMVSRTLYHICAGIAQLVLPLFSFAKSAQIRRRRLSQTGSQTLVLVPESKIGSKRGAYAARTDFKTAYPRLCKTSVEGK